MSTQSWFNITRTNSTGEKACGRCGEPLPRGERRWVNCSECREPRNRVTQREWPEFTDAGKTRELLRELDSVVRVRDCNGRRWFWR